MPWLTVVVFLPLVGLPVLAAWTRATDTQARVVALVVALATFLVSLGMLGAFDPSLPGYQLVEHAQWVPSAGLSYLVGVDGFSVWLVVLTAFMTPLANEARRLVRARSIHGVSPATALRRIIIWKSAMISRASTSVGTPASMAATVTVSAFDSVSIPIVIRRAIVLADGIL